MDLINEQKSVSGRRAEHNTNINQTDYADRMSESIDFVFVSSRLDVYS